MTTIPSWLYWSFVFLGIIVVLVIFMLKYKMTGKQMEHFEDAVTTPIIAEPPTEPEPEQDEMIQEIPRKTKLQLYLTSFSEPSTYQCAASKWCDAINPDTRTFYMISANVPASITPTTGLPMKEIELRGPQAFTLGQSATNYHLNSFTAVFYAKIKSLDALDTPTKSIVILDIPAQSPHRVQVAIKPNEDDASKAILSITFGSECTLAATTTEFEFDRSFLIGTVNTPSLYALVFDKEKKKLQFYTGINEPPKENAFPTNAPDVVLGVSPMTINKTRNWDANLVAFALYSVPLTSDEIRMLDTYFMQHVTGVTTIVRAKETLENEVQNLLRQVNTGENTIKELLQKLQSSSQTCGTAEATNEMIQKLKKWQIKMDGSVPITASDLGKCSILGVKGFGAPATEPTTTAPETAPTSATKQRYKIPYPPEVSSSTASSAPSSTNIANPTKPATSTTSPASNSGTAAPAPASPTSPSAPVEGKNDDDFWKTFFKFLQNQQDKTEETEEKTDLNDVYDKLRDEVTDTDREEPGNALLSNTTTQDPAKEKEEEETPEETEKRTGFWKGVYNIFLT